MESEEPHKMNEDQSDLTINMYIDVPEQGRITIPVSAGEAFRAYRALQMLGFEDTRALLLFAGKLARAITEHNVPDPALAQEVVWRMLANQDLHVEDWEDQEEILLSLSYIALKHRMVDRATAAAIADRYLKGVTKESWRKAVDRWAKRKKLEQIGFPRPKRRTKQSR